MTAAAGSRTYPVALIVLASRIRMKDPPPHDGKAARIFKYLLMAFGAYSAFLGIRVFAGC
jgi:hypothetical protein